MHQTGQVESSTLWHFIVELFAKQSTKQVKETFLFLDTFYG